MQTTFLCDTDSINLRVPDDAVVYESRFPAPAAPASETVMEAIRNPVGTPPLAESLRSRRSGKVVIVVSDITRPVPYPSFLAELIEEIESAGVDGDQILILVATGMHRPTTPAEQREMLGEVAEDYRVVNHDATDDANLVELPGKSWAGADVRLDRRFMEAGFRIVTGLVEPHFMAGFSGGRKAVCPGLVALETVRQFHGHAFLSNPLARNGNLEGNPLHLEALSVARMAGVDFSLNVVMNRERRVVGAFAGELQAAHGAACSFAADCACRTVTEPADVVVTSSGGYPLDATFYQCVKGFVSCLPAVRPRGTIVAFGGCSEGVGSTAYDSLMERYSGRWRSFLEDIKQPDYFVKDQWQFQFHARALRKVGQDRLHFVTPGLPQETLDYLSVNGYAVNGGRVKAVLQELVDAAVADDATVAVLSEGPYCAPVPAD